MSFRHVFFGCYLIAAFLVIPMSGSKAAPLPECVQECKTTLEKRKARFKNVRQRRQARCNKMAVKAMAFCKAPSDKGATECKSLLDERKTKCAEVKKERLEKIATRYAYYTSKIGAFCQKACDKNAACAKTCPTTRKKFYDDWREFMKTYTTSRTKDCLAFATARHGLCLKGLSKDKAKCGKYASHVKKTCSEQNKLTNDKHAARLETLYKSCAKYCVVNAPLPKKK